MIFECPRGHRVETANPFYWRAFAVPEHNWEEERVLLDSGPLCQVCFVEWMGKQFPTTEISESCGPARGGKE